MCTGLQNTHTMLYQRTTDACLGPQLSSQIFHATLNHTRNVSDSGAVVRYTERPYMTCSFKLSVQVRTNGLLERETAMHDWSHNSPIVHVSQIQLQPSKQISLIVEQSFNRQNDCYNTSLIFKVVRVIVHKIAYRQEPVMCIWSHNLPILA